MACWLLAERLADRLSRVRIIRDGSVGHRRAERRRSLITTTSERSSRATPDLKLGEKTKLNAPPILEIVHATHRYGDTVALDDVSVAARQGEFLTILGESGSGKTTLLRMISGLERPSEVQALRLNGEDVVDLPAYERNCTTVFQSYALFPHLTVGKNVEYGLRVRGVPAGEREERARAALGMVRLEDTFERRIHQLSGGQRQRVALARAIVTRPAMLLLDEPLGALDEKLRQDMQVELMEIHKRLSMTFVYITHSQEEALTMSDRIILMRRGKIAQEGTPQELFDQPASRFTAAFMGVENLMEGKLVALQGDRARVEVAGQVIVGRWPGGVINPGEDVVAGVRAERLHLGPPPAQAEANWLPCSLQGSIYKGKYLDQTATTPVGEIKIRLWEQSAAQGEPGGIWWKQSDCMVMRP
ncbi:putative spermidine/putrescine transport system ATP-binding protein [Arboricoccus pini]|uniref:Putative spermidine/putrescine transport system ATP-binding protein n=1 Tax=Arboricoccus pini TaxID=1963835 RepID=A0A212RJ00_9PROT|nr:ABC transporter ATP-binding protein [Arboricoccus pini]SNB72335.1 putative spermidine/putrescine transport system ATP-binding protein [Arboricoccus pini]